MFETSFEKGVSAFFFYFLEKLTVCIDRKMALFRIYMNSVVNIVKNKINENERKKERLSAGKINTDKKYIFL